MIAPKEFLESIPHGVVRNAILVAQIIELLLGVGVIGQIEIGFVG